MAIPMFVERVTPIAAAPVLVLPAATELSAEKLKPATIAIPMRATAATLPVQDPIRFAATVSSNAVKIVTMATQWTTAMDVLRFAREWAAAAMVSSIRSLNSVTMVSPMPAERAM